jgi:hypothetical protein
MPPNESPILAPSNTPWQVSTKAGEQPAGQTKEQSAQKADVYTYAGSGLGALDSRDDRPCALDVKDAGDWAIHDFGRFKKVYGGERLSEVLANTRKVLLDLYRRKPDSRTQTPN